MGELSKKAARGRCVYCGKTFALTKRGKVRKHEVIAGPTTLAPGQRVTCGGSGRQPT